MEKNIKKYISNVKNIHLLLENINKDILTLNNKLELLKEVNNVRLDEKHELIKNIINKKVQTGGSGVSNNLEMNDELDLKIKNLQDKVDAIVKKTRTLQEITHANIKKTQTNIANLSQLNNSVNSIIGDPDVTANLKENISKLNHEDYEKFSSEELFEKVKSQK